MGMNDGMTMNVLIRAPGRHIVGVDDDESKLTTFEDDKKTNLGPAKKEGFGMQRNWLGSFPQIAPDGSGCAVELQSQSRPAKDATKVLFKGSVSVVCGADEKSAEQKGLKLVKDSKLTAGPVPMTISDVSDEAWGDYKMSFTFAFNQDDSAIKGFVFTDASGKKIEHDRGGGSRMTFGAMKNYDVQWRLKEKVDVVNVKVIYYNKMEKVAVPVELATGVGF